MARAAELELQRDCDASQAMKDHEISKLETLAKTARLRAARLAQSDGKIPAPKTTRSKIYSYSSAAPWLARCQPNNEARLQQEAEAALPVFFVMSLP